MESHNRRGAVWGYGEPLLEGSAMGPPGGCSRVGQLQAEQGDLR